MSKLIIANWKSNPDSSGNAALLAAKIEKEISSVRGVEAVIAPPYHFFSEVKNNIRKAQLGAQNMFWENVGPFTGEISWRHLRQLKIKYVIVGHSERRRLLGETGEMINKKVIAALENGLHPVLCVGEQTRDAEDDSSVKDALSVALSGVKRNWLKNLVVAYEPVWAISTTPDSKPDTPANAFRAGIHIRKIITSLFDAKSAQQARIIYGGSVNSKNIWRFLGEGKMQGALVGASSLKPEEFAEIVAIAAKTK